MTSKNKHKASFYNIRIVFTLLFFLILITYSNAFQSSWHFDDKPNIVQNFSLHLRDLSPDSIYKTFFAQPQHRNKLYRPVTCLTFALNWYFGKDNVAGYHAVNIIIHILTAFILCITILNLFKSPNLKDKFNGNELFIALLTAVLWAENPIQTQAVTYIVQRMAVLAAMFYILSIYFYIKARIADSLSNRIFFIIGCILSFLLAIGSKENAAILPLALILVEIIFFQDLGPQKTRRLFLGISVATGLLVVLIGIFFFMKGDPSYFLKGYANRPFSFTERLMTEPRIVIYYLSQIFYPVPGRLSIVHDVIASTSLFKPWNTLPAILAVFLLVGIAFYLIKKRPIIAFAILFFFLNHIIESSIIPLELFFEHRNYLPSLFLFFPVSVGIKRLIDYYRGKKFSMYIIIVSFVILLLVGIGTSTYIRNMAWTTEKSLWEDATSKAPGSARPYYRLAVLYSETGRLNQSMALLKKGISLKQQKPVQSKLLFYNNMGNIYRKKHEYEKAVQYFKLALDVGPDYQIVRENMVLALIGSKKWDEASRHVDILLKERYFNYAHPYLKGLILIRQQKATEAILYLRSALKMSPYSKDTLLNIGVAFSLSGEYSKAKRFFRRALTLYPNDALILLRLAENSLKTDDGDKADEYLGTLLSVFGGKRVQEFIERQSKDSFSLPLSYDILIPAIAEKLKKSAVVFTGATSKLTSCK